MTPEDIDDWIYSATKRKSPWGKSVHRCAHSSYEGGYGLA